MSANSTAGAHVSPRATGGRARRAARAAVRCVLAVLLALPGAATASASHDIVLMLDNSGSMRKNDPDLLMRIAVRTFLERLGEDDRVAIVAFDQKVEVLMPLTRVDDANRARLLASLTAIDYAGLLTNSPAALERSIYELRTSARAHTPGSIVFLTDGIVDVAPEGPDPGDVEKARWMKTALADEAAAAGMRVFGIAFTDDADFELMQTLAQRTGGEYFRAYRASDLDGVFRSIIERLGPGPSPDAAHADRGAASVPSPAGAVGAPGLRSSLPRTGLPDLDVPEVALPPIDRPPASPAQADIGTAEPAVVPAAPAGMAGTGATHDEPARPRGALPGAGAEQSQRTSAKPPRAIDPSPARERASGGNTAPVLAIALGGAALALGLAGAVIGMRRRRHAPAAAAPAGTAAPRALLHDLDTGTAHEVSQRPLIVGRLRGPQSEAADHVVIDESTIGRRHAIVEYRDHAFWITDQDSLNGTFVNNAHIETPTRLKHGDRIRFHKYEFEFLVTDMLETERTMMSDTSFADVHGDVAPHGADDEAAAPAEPPRDAPAPAGASPDDPTITRR